MLLKSCLVKGVGVLESLARAFGLCLYCAVPRHNLEVFHWVYSHEAQPVSKFMLPNVSPTYIKVTVDDLALDLEFIHLFSRHATRILTIPARFA